MKNTSGYLKKREVVMLANGHSPFDTRIFIKECQSLQSAGHQVSIILPHTINEQRNSITIQAVTPAPGGWGKLVINPWRILKKALQQNKQAVFHIHDSDILLVGVILKLLRRKVIYDAHEDTPLQISYQHWVPAILKKPYAWFYFLLEKFCGWQFDKIVVAEPVIAKYFPPHKTYLIRNFPIAQVFKIDKAPAYHERSKRLTCIGTLSEVRGLFEMLNGAKLASEKLDFEFLLGGKFAPASLEQQVLTGYSVNYQAWIQFNDLVNILFDSQIGIIVPHPTERYKTNYPVKMFEFMAAGLPVIASREGESAAFIQEANCGILVDPLNAREIADAIIWLFTHPDEAAEMGKRGQDLIFKKYNWENESQILDKLYNSL